MKKVFCLILCLLCLCNGSFAEPFRVYDNADLFNEQEEQHIESKIDEFRQKNKIDFAVLTTDDFIAKGEQETKGATVETIRGYQIAFDEDLLSLTKSVEDLVAGMNQEDAVRSNLMLTEQGIGEGMASIHSLMASWVGSINSELAKIGEMDAMSSVRVNENGVRRGGGAGTQRIPGHASGLSYVPYDDYGAYLHRGEAVLTRQQAEEYRAGSTARATDSTAVIRKLDAVVESIRGISVYLDGEKVGHALTPYVSGEIGREAGVFY